MANVGYLLAAMDKIVEPGGTLLDNSLVYVGNEFGELTPSSAHTYQNMIVMVAGGGTGTFRMGYYVDYRKTNGMPINNLLVSFFNAMGLASSDYEQDGVAGFGEYASSAVSELNMGAYTSTNSARRAPLPFLYTGAALG
jgi:hypothetical protein